jgi:hypothetical protein
MIAGGRKTLNADLRDRLRAGRRRRLSSLVKRSVSVAVLVASAAMILIWMNWQ